MVTIEEILLPQAAPAAELWAAVAAQTGDWLRRRRLSPRDAVMLVPYAALLGPARDALAAAGGWMPRVETALTLAASLGPPVAVEAGQCSGDTTADRLNAAALLRRLPWGASWEARDAAGFGRVVASVVDAAQALREAALAQPPQARAGWWADVRTQAGAGSAAAAVEALLLRVAIEWAATGAAAASDRLFDLRPAAWIALRLGGPDALAESLLAQGAAPALRLRADPPDALPYEQAALAPGVERVLCADFEDEAQATAATIIDALQAGRAPVALVALDRELVRRVRALLEREAVPLLDETGWLLATTRAAARLLARLRAALPGAGPDARLEWLKSWPPAAVHEPAALDALEALWRGRRHVPDRAGAERLWEAAQQHLLPLVAAGRRPLASWLRLVLDGLDRDGTLVPLAADAAGSQVLACLGWPQPAPWQDNAPEVRLDLPGFIAWVEDTLEQQPYLPPPDAAAQVVLTPLARAFGRPCAQAVVPGADALRLSVGDAPPALIGDALASAIGLDHAAARRLRQRQALAQLLRVPRVTLLRRRRDGDELVADSPDVEWLQLERARAGLPAWPLVPWQPALRSVPLQPVPRPQPTARGALPERLSASQLEALRQCPYRFFARAVLRLDEPDELEAALAKRDYGNWLHAVLHRFHSRRDATRGDAGQLQQAAEAVTHEQGLDAGELLPFRASFEHFAPAYLAWLAGREAAGWRWQEGETDHRRSPPELDGLQLGGRIDRLDRGPGSARQLIDYKTGNADALARKVKTPLEDTQLAFYAALLDGDADFSASYLALDDAKAPREISHDDVQRSAATLLEGLGGEWQRLRAGAPMPALGEGAVCDTCEARGLCRRDHWAERR